MRPDWIFLSEPPSPYFLNFWANNMGNWWAYWTRSVRVGICGRGKLVNSDLHKQGTYTTHIGDPSTSLSSRSTVPVYLILWVDHRLFSNFSFLNHFSPTVSNPVAWDIDSSVITNSNEPTLAQLPLKFRENVIATAKSNPSNFCREGRNPDSCNISRLFLYSVICSISINRGSILTSAMSIQIHPLPISKIYYNKKNSNGDWSTHT